MRARAIQRGSPKDLREVANERRLEKDIREVARIELRRRGLPIKPKRKGLGFGDFI